MRRQITLGKTMWLLVTFFNQAHCSSNLCNDRYGPLPMDDFIHRSCTLCYAFITQNTKPLIPHPMDMQSLMARNASDVIALSGPVVPDPRNESTLQTVCSTLSDDMCVRWRSCCEASMVCCEDQLKTPLPPPDAGMCLRTWDGYSCWPDTPADTQPVVQCPSYIEHALPNKQGYKQCTVNGTWFKNQGLEWSDYRACLDKQGYLVSVYIAVGFNAASFLLLLPAVVIFASFRGLYQQHRVRLHINFFLSLAVMCAVNILWYMLVHYDLLVSPSGSETVLSSNPTWCRLLSFLKIYLTSSNYFWAFCEGFYLHHLIAKAFEPPKSLLPMYLLGWGAPFVPAFIYGIMRVCLDNTSRGLKAVFMLIPLFGLQLFLTIYRPPPASPGEKEYEYMTFVITSSQGIFVSLIFCFFNGEVLSQVRANCPCCKKCPGARKQQNQQGTTHMTMVTVADYDRSPGTSDNNHCAEPRMNSDAAKNGSLKNTDYTAVPTYPNSYPDYK